MLPYQVSKNESETSPLLDDDPYQAACGYGATGSSQLDSPEAEMLRREREALDAICQRTSEAPTNTVNSSVIDIWALNPQTYQPPRHREATEAPMMRAPQQFDDSRPQSERSFANKDVSIGGGEFGGMRYMPLRHESSGSLSKASTKHWAEVVTTNRKGKKTRLGLEAILKGPSETEENDVFGVLEVK
ncbi:hypothetical protein KEM56_007631 [Ascosphaera pollenicola]|nr:hypothetical protein KEM56_007631 [Ascosphaera pollenicola]